MSSNEIAVPAATAAPDRVGQATAVEQSRAVAEVQGAILVAQRCPRNVSGAVAEMEQSCNQKGLADRAFYAVPRAGGTVNGPTVHLARELARVWGNVQYGVSEMRRDDGHGQSEMKAFAWDVQTNTRVETTFVVPHIRDRSAKAGGPLKLTSMDDIYMSNANAGARRVRECIFSILPPWFVEQAKELCQKTLEHGGGEPLPRRIAKIIAAFDELDVSVDQLEARIGRPNAKWTARDVAQLTTVGGSLRRGEVQRDEVFPPQRVTADEILGQASETPAKPATRRKQAGPDIAKLLESCGVTVPAAQRTTVGMMVGHDVAEFSALTAAEKDTVVERLQSIAGTENPGMELDVYLSSLESESVAP